MTGVGYDALASSVSFGDLYSKIAGVIDRDLRRRGYIDL